MPSAILQAPSYGVRPAELTKPDSPSGRVWRCRDGFWAWAIVDDEERVIRAYMGYPTKNAAMTVLGRMIHEPRARIDHDSIRPSTRPAGGGELESGRAATAMGRLLPISLVPPRSFNSGEIHGPVRRT